MKLTAYVYQDKYTKLKFLKEKTTKFITWICPLMKADFFEQDEYFFNEGDQVDHFFFIKSGKAQFVLPEYNNLPYLTVSHYNHFGFIDIVSSSIKNKFHVNDWWNNYHSLKRDFTVRASEDTDVFYLTC